MSILKNLFGICILALLMVAFLNFLEDLKRDEKKIVNIENYRKKYG